MTIKTLSFEQALKRSENYGKKHLLLGNGFSIACKPDIFAYGSLFEACLSGCRRHPLQVDLICR